jgi:hypothetical protein
MKLRSKVEMVALRARIVVLTQRDPTLPRSIIALRCGCHEGTVRDAQKAAGVYVERVRTGRRKAKQS